MKGFVIIPTYNEKDNIEKTVREVTVVLDSIKFADFGILVVDSGSPDGTADLVKSIIPSNSRLSLTTEKVKKGLGAAYFYAMDYAFDKLGAEAVVQFDADLSHPPEKIKEFIQRLEEGYDLVIGTRYRKGGGIPRNWGLHRKVLSKFGNLFIRIMFWGSGVTDWTSGFKGMNKKTFRQIRNRVDSMKGYTFQTSCTKNALDSGAKVIEIPYKFTDRVYGESKMGAEYIMNVLFFVTKTKLRELSKSRFGKVFAAGGVGFTAQILIYPVLRYFIVANNIFNLPETTALFGMDFHFRVLIATALAIETGVITSYTINNLWAFGDKTRKGISFIRGLVKVNLVISGAIVIQFMVVALGTAIFGTSLFIDLFFMGIGVLLGLIWNFYFYKTKIWKIKGV